MSDAENVLILPQYEAEIYGIKNGLIRVEQSLGRLVFTCNDKTNGDKIVRSYPVGRVAEVADRFKLDIGNRTCAGGVA
ncbi:hypothetical protein [uncultured Umboniibacter sp.]|uniref:hypothetical protein n=1 Tax=uncultured Umboniibacter sp. TaxID=1798917 RepID=UPI00260FF6EC|nr:hypothetical protein [uncultured Umboniibacter sp.]